MEIDLSTLSETIKEVLVNLVRRGWVPPFNVAAVATNGAFYFSTFRPNRQNGGWDIETRALRLPEEGIREPVHLLLVTEQESMKITMPPEAGQGKPAQTFSEN